MIVVDGKPQASKVWNALLKGLLVQLVLAVLILIPTAVQDGGDLALVPAHSKQLHCKFLAHLLEAKILRLYEAKETVVVKNMPLYKIIQE